MLPFIKLKSNYGRDLKALVDSGCQQTIICNELCDNMNIRPKGPSQVVTMLNGERTQCCGDAVVELWVDDQRLINRCLVAPLLVCGADVILGMDVIKCMGGVSTGKDSSVIWGNNCCAAGAVSVRDDKRMQIEDSDFSAVFDGEKWTIEWKWVDGEPKLENRCPEYAVPDRHREEFDSEVQQWVSDGWLEPYNAQVHGKADGIIPLMAAEQPNKPKKVRPVMDYRELNEHVKSNPGQNTAVCQEKLREWRMRDKSASMLDLKKAYLQIHVANDLRRFQMVKYKGTLYVMTRMGFGLNVAPKIMSKIISAVLALDKEVLKATDHYIDDIWVDESLVKVAKVREHLQKYGLMTKDPVPLADARVLGLRVVEDESGQLMWRRDGGLPALAQTATKRELFSFFGKLIGHYPVAGWLRTACSYVKRQANVVSWDEEIPDNVRTLAEDMLQRVAENDPVRGRWTVPRQGCGIVWCDASSLAIGCSLEIDNCTVEDNAWLRKEDDGVHINVAELEAVLKGLNLALRWELTDIKLMTDSASVYSWIKSLLEDTKRAKVSGLSEMIVKRRLSTVGQLIDEYSLRVCIQQVPSVKNAADVLTRVPQKWLRKTCMSVAVADDAQISSIKEIHNKNHLGVERTLYLVKKMRGITDRKLVEQVVTSCHRCRRVDPSPVKWNHGSLEVDKVWYRIAVDVTFVAGQPYLTLIDCGPSRFAIWSSLANETAQQVIKHLKRVFQERGPPAELLCDNGLCFKRARMQTFLSSWGVSQVFCCAYKHSGNGIIERHHRTIKRMVARTGGAIQDMVYWYNNTPNSDRIVPADAIYSYKARLLGEPVPARQFEGSRESNKNSYQAGDQVYVKPGKARCDTMWRRGIVTRVQADNVVEVDGVNRHVADVRHVEQQHMPNLELEQQSAVNLGVELDYRADGDYADIDGDDGSNDDNAYEDDSDSSDEEPVVRDRRPPQWLVDFYIHE